MLLVLNTRCVFSVLLCHQGKAGDNGKPGTPGKMVTRLSVCLSVCLSVWIFVCLPVWMSGRLSVCLPVCLSV